MKREDIKKIAIDCGFNETEQENGEKDIDERLYKFAEKIGFKTFPTASPYRLSHQNGLYSTKM